MPYVLGMCSRAEVCLAVVKAIMVDVVAVKTIGKVENEVVHTEIFPFLFFAVCERVNSIASVSTNIKMPFVFAYSGIIFWVNDGEFALAQRYSPKGVPVSQPTI